MVFLYETLSIELPFTSCTIKAQTNSRKFEYLFVNRQFEVNNHPVINLR